MSDPAPEARRQTFCLNMIVKDEAPVIRRCLDSVRPLIDCWVIVDTGSTDDTKDLVREALKDLPGELHERPWVDFAHNRTEALELARGRADYIVLIDADEVLDIDAGFAMPTLTDDVYSVMVRYSGCTYTRRQFLRDGLAWRYEGVLHEYVTAPGLTREAGLAGLTLAPRHDGARARDPLTYRRDALALERALLQEPDNTRYVFYLAQSYRDASDLELALRWYRKRAAMGGWKEEVWYSLYQVAQIQERMQAPWPETLESYLAAHQFLPDRAGPLYRIGMHYTARREYQTAHLFLSRAVAIPAPEPGRLFVERPLYEFQIAAEYTVAAHYAGEYANAITAANAVLRGGLLPAHAIDQVVVNRRFSVDALVPKSEEPPRDPGRLRVVVAFRDAGPELDDCVDSLMQQDLAEWDAFFIDDGSARDPGGRIPDDPRVTLVRHDAAKGVEARIAEHLGGIADPGVAVLPLSARDRLADAGALRRIRAAFADPGCLVAYGQFRTPAGSLGDAEPAAGEADFRARGPALAGNSAVAVRADAWRGSLDESWRCAGFGATRFLDAAITIRGGARPRVHVAEPAPPPAAQPKISCVMVTLDRLSLAKRAIQSYADQGHPNRELLIVTDGTARFRDALERHVDASGIAGVRFVQAPAGQSLGALRNLSLTEARGDIVCQWDDDDCSHPDRLRVQLGDMLARGARASFMTDHLHLVADQRTLCWIDWTLGGGEGTARLFPGTLMMFADPRFRYPESGPFARRGEDSVLLEQIHAAVPVAHLGGAGHLYLYEYHGRNTFSRAHHLNLTNYRTSASHLVANFEILRDALAYYSLPRPVAVVGREGPVLAVS
jgi:glycosyltransferase involved in cell wall biosynthesis